MNVRMQTAEPVERFCAKIRNALLSDDVDALLDHCVFPLSLINVGQTAIVEEAATAEKLYGMFRM
ncbi:MAG: hypothetical protein ACRED3_17030, partial [Bradyrhizobium sp.]